MRTRVTLLSLSLAAAGLGCGDVSSDCQAPDDCSDDLISPTITAISPADAANGVSFDEPIVIDFSEPMDRNSALVAVSIQPPAAVLQEIWNADDTQLTILFSLEYAETNYPAVPGDPNSYTITVSTTAEDVAGNALEVASSSTFSTFNRTLHNLQIDAAMTGNTPVAYVGKTFLGAGWPHDEDTGFRHGYVTFDITPFPSEAVASIESAIIESAIRDITGDPYARFGSMLIEHTSFATRPDSAVAVALKSLGTMVPATPAPQVGDIVAKDVTSAFLADESERVARSNRSQYLLRFPNPGSPGSTDFSHLHNRSVEGNRTLLVVRTLTP